MREREQDLAGGVQSRSAAAPVCSRCQKESIKVEHSVHGIDDSAHTKHSGDEKPLCAVRITFLPVCRLLVNVWSEASATPGVGAEQHRALGAQASLNFCQSRQGGARSSFRLSFEFRSCSGLTKLHCFMGWPLQISNQPTPPHLFKSTPSRLRLKTRNV